MAVLVAIMTNVG